MGTFMNQFVPAFWVSREWGHFLYGLTNSNLHFVNETNQNFELNICFYDIFSLFRALLQNCHGRFRPSLQGIQLCADASRPMDNCSHFRPETDTPQTAAVVRIAPHAIIHCNQGKKP